MNNFRGIEWYWIFIIVAIVGALMLWFFR